MKRTMALLVVALALISCGGGLTPAASASLHDAVSLNLQADQLLDGGPARALERGAYCSTASVLADYGQPLPDAGISCKSP